MLKQMSTCQIYLSVHRRHNRSDIANRATIIQLRKRSSNALIISCLRVNRDALSIGNDACHTRKILTSRKIRRFPFPFFLSAKKSGKEELNDSKFFPRKLPIPWIFRYSVCRDADQFVSGTKSSRTFSWRPALRYVFDQPRYSKRPGIFYSLEHPVSGSFR